MTAPVFRPSEQHAIIDLQKRVRALEAVPAASGASDFVFLAEVELSAAASVISFPAISQAYRHLRLEASLGGDTGGVGLVVQLNGQTSDYTTLAQYSAVTVGIAAPPATYYGISDDGVYASVGLDLPETSLAGSGAPGYGSLILELPYYTCPPSADDERVPIVNFAANGNNDDEQNWWTATGSGFYNEGANTPVTQIDLAAVGMGSQFSEKSIASLYGIR